MIRILRLLNTSGGRIFLLIVAVYPLLALLVPSRILIEIGDAFVLPMALAAAIVYLMQLWRQPSGRAIDAIDIVMAGIMGAWLVNFLDRGTRLGARLFDKSLHDSTAIGFFLVLLTFFAACHLRAASVRVIPDRVPLDGRKIIAVALAVGVLLAAVILYIEWDALKGAVPF